MSKKLTISNSYADLLVAIKMTLSSGLLAAQKALEYERLQTYWKIGKDIDVCVAASRGTLIPGKKLYQQVSIDIHEQTGLELTADTISRVVQFSRNYPGFPENTTLTFTHYIVLQRIPNVKLRLQLEKTAVRKNMNVAQTRAAVREINAERALPVREKARSLVCERGEPYVYLVRPRHDLRGKKNFCIDCGFKISVDVDGGTPPKKIDFQAVEKRPARVVDGDTVDVRIDVGFGIGLDERLRLKGINTPELKTQDGKRARDFLVAYLSQCPAIIIRTSKEGMFGRWLADIYALQGCADPFAIAAKGECVNQLLLDEGLAEVY